MFEIGDGSRALRRVTSRSTTSTSTSRRSEITAIIGPSGCGKSTFLRCLNRMNDFIPGAKVERHDQVPRRGPVRLQGRRGRGAAADRHGVPEAEPVPEVDLRQRRVRPADQRRDKGELDELVEQALTRAALWDEVKDKLKKSAFALSGGQQQRLCIARALAVEPDVILMDEPCSALDPIATSRIEDLMVELKRDFTIVIVTHNMQQAARVSDMTAFFTTEVDDEARAGSAASSSSTRRETIFTSPSDPRTEGYITGRFG